MIQGVAVKELKIRQDHRGSVMHMMRSDDDLFDAFGEIYFSSINPGVVKGWKKHQKMTQHFVVPVGNLKLVLYDGREASSTKGKVQEIILGVDEYKLVKIPPEIWYSFTPVNNSEALIANCADLAHDPEESETLPVLNDLIPYKWDVTE